MSQARCRFSTAANAGPERLPGEPPASSLDTTAVEVSTEIWSWHQESNPVFRCTKAASHLVDLASTCSVREVRRICCCTPRPSLRPAAGHLADLPP